jgi:hypothetical protein
VAWSLPLTSESFTAPAAAVPGFFAGLLPEGRRLTALRRVPQLDRTALPGVQDQMGEWRVIPACDLPSSAVYGDRTMALPIGGRIRQQLSWTLLRSLGEAVGIPSRLAASVIREQVVMAGFWIEELEQLPFDADSINNRRRLVGLACVTFSPIIRRSQSAQPPSDYPNGQYAGRES